MNSIIRSDHNTVIGFTVWAGAIFIVVNLLVDIAHTFTNPRKRDSVPRGPSAAVATARENRPSSPVFLYTPRAHILREAWT